MYNYGKKVYPPFQKIFQQHQVSKIIRLIHKSSIISKILLKDLGNRLTLEYILYFLLKKGLKNS